MSGASVADTLRFLSQDAKVPLAIALGKVVDLQKANMTSADQIAKADIEVVRGVFKDEKLAKQVLNAAKRVSKKRGAPSNVATASPQKKKKEMKITRDSTPFEVESSLSLPTSNASDSELCNMIIVTNRAPLVLAFAVCVLKYTMPEQPISSRLSLAQALVSANSRTKAVRLGIESGKSAEEEGWGEGHSTVKVLGREIRVLKRWDYNPREGRPENASASEESDANAEPAEEFLGNGDVDDANKMPPLWGIDLEATRKSQATAVGSEPKPTSSLPIYTAPSARSYLLRSIGKLQEGKPSKSKSAAATLQEKEDCVGHLVRAIDSVCSSWSTTLDSSELDRRAWAWYLRVRPEVQGGAQGWGEKGQVQLADILALRKRP
ncbi:hypothetical protein N7523_006192 [Penicillium sp. IBT 18751x]|nr:hypothetical protein N7523_006192 [Penicillium sp. IBT 18751x]